MLKVFWLHYFKIEGNKVTPSMSPKSMVKLDVQHAESVFIALMLCTREHAMSGTAFKREETLKRCALKTYQLLQQGGTEGQVEGPD